MYWMLILLLQKWSHWFLVMHLVLVEFDVVITGGKHESNLFVFVIFVMLSRSCRASTTFTLAAKSSTRTSNQKTSCCVQQRAAAPPIRQQGLRQNAQACFSTPLVFLSLNATKGFILYVKCITQTHIQSWWITVYLPINWGLCGCF